jgi:hypothetical protein
MGQGRPGCLKRDPADFPIFQKRHHFRLNIGNIGQKINPLNRPTTFPDDFIFPLAPIR